MKAPASVIFIVDDDPSVRKSLTRVMVSAGYAVEAFASAREFLERERLAGPGCLILDVRMPGLSGLDLQEALAGKGHRIPIVFITGHGDISMSVKAMKSGAADFLTKPYDLRAAGCGREGRLGQHRRRRSEPGCRGSVRDRACQGGGEVATSMCAGPAVVADRRPRSMPRITAPGSALPEHSPCDDARSRPIPRARSWGRSPAS